MRFELHDHEYSQRTIGAIVVTKYGTETVSIDAGPADGLPLVRIKLSRAQALQLSANLRAVANGRDEEVLLADQ
jgi:hypothetical protein